MSRMRSVVRAYALEHTSPATVLQRVDAKFCHFEPNEMATLMYARLDADLGRMTIRQRRTPPTRGAAAGPGRGAARRPPRSADLHRRRRPSRRETVIDFAAGAVAVLYTDGLVERRHEPIDDRLELLRRTVAGGDAEQIAADIMIVLIGNEPVDDDTALLVVART